jgi:hypothetical protein
MNVADTNLVRDDPSLFKNTVSTFGRSQWPQQETYTSAKIRTAHITIKSLHSLPLYKFTGSHLTGGIITWLVGWVVS